MNTHYDTPTLLNIIGLCIDIFGALLMFLNSPRVSFQVYFYQKQEAEVLERKARRMHRLTQVGALLLIMGFLLQVGGNLLE